MRASAHVRRYGRPFEVDGREHLVSFTEACVGKPRGLIRPGRPGCGHAKRSFLPVRTFFAMQRGDVRCLACGGELKVTEVEEGK